MNQTDRTNKNQNHLPVLGGWGGGGGGPHQRGGRDCIPKRRGEILMKRAHFFGQEKLVSSPIFNDGLYSTVVSHQAQVTLSPVPLLTFSLNLRKKNTKMLSTAISYLVVTTRTRTTKTYINVYVPACLRAMRVVRDKGCVKSRGYSNSPRQ